MATVKVKFREPSVPGNKGTVIYQISHGSKTRFITTSYQLYPAQWNQRRSMPVSDIDSESSDISEITKNINRDIRLLDRIIKILYDRSITFDTDDITARFQQTTIESSLFNFMNATINRLVNNGRIRTSETYTAALRSFHKFRDGRDIMLDELDTDTIEAYQTYLRASGLVPNSISFYMRILRALYNRAVEAGLAEQRKPFRHVYTGIDKTVKRALPISKIRQMRNLELSRTPALAYARDIFMLSFYLRGMSFIDMAFLRKTDLHNNRITYRRHKTGQRLTIACTPEMKTILNRYPGNTSEYLLPIIPPSVTDKRKAYRNQSYTINRRLKQIAVMLDISTPLTLYVARHSWASAAKVNGIPISIISQGMGHDSEATTQIYLSSLDTSVIDHANSLILSSLL